MQISLICINDLHFQALWIALIVPLLGGYFLQFVVRTVLLLAGERMKEGEMVGIITQSEVPGAELDSQSDVHLGNPP